MYFHLDATESFGSSSAGSDFTGNLALANVSSRDGTDGTVAPSGLNLGRKGQRTEPLLRDRIRNQGFALESVRRQLDRKRR